MKMIDVFMEQGAWSLNVPLTSVGDITAEVYASYGGWAVNFYKGNIHMTGLNKHVSAEIPTIIFESENVKEKAVFTNAKFNIFLKVLPQLYEVIKVFTADEYDECGILYEEKSTGKLILRYEGKHFEITA